MPTFRYRRFVLAGSLGLAAIFLGAWLFGSPPPPNPLVIKGYLEIVPPSKFHGPGTISTVEILRDGEIGLLTTCNIDAEDLARYSRKSRTVDEDIVQALSRSFDISGKMDALLSASAAGRSMQTTTISFKNVHLLTSSTESLFELQKKYIRGSCEEAIIHNLKRGGVVCQAAEVLQADAVIEVNYSGELSESEKIQATHRIAGDLGLTVQHETANRVVGEGLFYGIKLAPLGVVLQTPDAIVTKCQPLG